MGVGRLRQLAWAGTPGLLLTAAALFWGARGGTVHGVLVVGSATLGITVLPPLLWEASRALRLRGEGGARA
jgi:hypothetical protein